MSQSQVWAVRQRLRLHGRLAKYRPHSFSQRKKTVNIHYNFKITLTFLSRVRCELGCLQDGEDIHKFVLDNTRVI